MTNPYESPLRPKQHAEAAPYWYVLFYRLYWPAWWTGTALIAGSWFNIVSQEVGWVGFGLAGASALGAYVLPSLAGIKSEDYVVLDSRLLSTKGETYSDAMQRFSNGATLMYDGVAFAFRPNNEIACGVVAQSPNINDSEAHDIADYAKSIFDNLIQSSPVFATAVDGHTFRVSIMSSMDVNSTELFRVVNGKVEPKC